LQHHYDVAKLQGLKTDILISGSQVLGGLKAFAVKHSPFWCIASWFRDPGQAKLKGLGVELPPKLDSWTVLWVVRSGRWDAPTMIQTAAATTLRTLSPPADGVLYFIRACYAL
jgi:hypothetical protein